MNGDWLPSGWETVQIGNIVKPARRSVTVEPDTLYREIGIRSHGKGIFYKEPISGKDLGDKRVFWVEPGCFVVNIVFAWEGAVAQTTPSEVGMIASHRFPMYKPDADRLDLDFITYFFKSKKGIHLLGLASPGGAGRNKTLGQQNFLQLEIPLPPLKEQKKMAAILQTCDEAINLTEQLIAAKQWRKQALMQRLLTGQVRFPGFADEWKDVKLEGVAKTNPLKTANITDEMQVSFVGMADVSEEAKLINQTTKRYAEVKNGFTPFINDDILVAKITPCFENGKGALAQNLKNGLGFGSTEFHVIRASPEKANVHFLYYHTITHQFRERGKSTMTGSAGQKRVPAEFVTSFKIGLPSLSEQSKIVDVLVTCDQELALHQQKLAARRRQKQGLMQQLLTGRVRVA